MKREGFTLAETVVAMALFAAAAAVFCQTALHARMALQRVGVHEPNYSRVRWIHYDVLRILDRETLEEGGEIELAPRVRKAAVEQDQVSEPVTARWIAEILPTPVLDVHEVTLTIGFMQGEATEDEYVLVYYVYRMDWYDEGEREELLHEKQEYWSRIVADRR